MRPVHVERIPRRSTTTRRVIGALIAAGGLVSTLSVAGASGVSHAKGVVIATATTTRYGTILVSGRTLYTLTPSATMCTKTCLQFWNAVLLPKGVTKATAGPGVSAAKLGTVKLASGERQVTYGSRRLYWFFEDKRPGQVKGNLSDTWGRWSDVVLVRPAKSPTTTTTRPASTTTTTTKGAPPVTTTTTKPASTTTTITSGGGGVGF